LENRYACRQQEEHNIAGTQRDVNAAGFFSYTRKCNVVNILTFIGAITLARRYPMQHDNKVPFKLHTVVYPSRGCSPSDTFSSINAFPGRKPVAQPSRALKPNLVSVIRFPCLQEGSCSFPVERFYLRRAHLRVISLSNAIRQRSPARGSLRRASGGASGW